MDVFIQTFSSKFEQEEQALQDKFNEIKSLLDLVFKDKANLEEVKAKY